MKTTLQCILNLFSRVVKTIYSGIGFTRLTKSVITQIVGIIIAYDSWLHLNEAFCCFKGKNYKIIITTSDYKKNGQSMPKYLQIKKIIDNLSTIEKSVIEQDQLLYSLRGLGYEYKSFVISIISRMNAPNLDEINSLFMLYSMNLIFLLSYLYCHPLHLYIPHILLYH